MRGIARALGVLAAMTAAQPALSQEAEAPAPQQPVIVIQSSILVLDTEELFLGSAYGRRVLQDIQADSLSLNQENREIEAELTAEELALTEQRATLSAEEFRPLAEAFDRKAQQIRAEQRAKATEIRSRPDQARQEFIQLTQAILAQIMRENRALAIFERSEAVLFAEAIDITQLAIARIDAVLGDGSE